MAATRLEFLSALLVLLSSSESAFGQTRCCTDKQYTADILSYGGQVANTHGNAIDGASTMYYDYTNKRIAYAYKHSPLQQQILDFQAHKAYTVFNGDCSMTELPTESYFPPPCISANATFVGAGFMGPEEKGIKFEAWDTTFRLDNVTRREKSVFLVDSCIPVSAYSYGAMPNLGSVWTAVIGITTNYKPGIADASVFNPPAHCHAS